MDCGMCNYGVDKMFKLYFLFFQGVILDTISVGSENRVSAAVIGCIQSTTSEH